MVFPSGHDRSAGDGDGRPIWFFQTVTSIIITRPWPAYGRHGLAGSSGGDQFWRKKLLTFSLAPSALRSVGTDHREVTSFGGKNSSGYFLLFIGR